ncbi:MAG: family 43 glycosylhydrolase [Spirochaetales bacterium]|nr:family 43 glycosylhydrolase [Spirochaetales bacterium]
MKNNKKFLMLSLVAFMVVSSMALFAEWQSDNGDGTFKNPPMYADYPDPSMIRVGDTFYLATSTFAQSPGLVICKSKDMVNWEIAGHAISYYPGGGAWDLNGGDKYGNGCFAPSIAYKDGTFYVIVTPNGESTRIYSTKDVSGTWTVANLNKGYFDPALFIDDDGTPYIVWGGAWENSIKMIQLNSTLTATTGSQRTIISYNNIEGSHLSKVNGTYYLFNAVPARSLVCSKATNVWGPYSGTTTLCSAGQGGHQGGIVDLPDGSYWGYLHQDDGAVGRMTRIAPITWQNGWPLFGRSGNTGRVESSYTKPIANQTIKVPATSDEFNSDKLGLQWMWNHNPDNSKWSLTGTALRLQPTRSSTYWMARNTLTQKGQGPTSYGMIKIDTRNMQSDTIGGIGTIGDPHMYIAVKGDTVIMSSEDSVKATQTNVTADTVYLRVNMNFNNKQATFFWGLSEASMTQLGPAVTMTFDWQNGTFQGEQYAILCYSPSGNSGYMDVDWFRMDGKPGENINTPEPTPSPTPNVEPIWTGGPYSLDGSTVYETIPAGIASELGDFSIGCQLNLNTLDTWTRVFDLGMDNNVFMMMTPDSGTTGFPYFAITISGNDGEQGIDSDKALQPGQWQHIAVVKEGVTAIMYIDGEEAGRNSNMTLSPSDMGNTIDNFIGRSQWEQDPYLNAEIDDFRIYNRAISANELAAWVSKETPTPTPIEGLLGDVNEDGTVNIVDALLVAQYYVNTPVTGFNPDNGDVDCSGTINIVDALLIAQYYVKMIDEFC